MVRILGSLVVIVALAAGPAAHAQTDAAATPIVVLNQERLLSQSLYGQRIQREVEAAGAALSAENREIEARLTEEELALTQRRATMTPEAFRPIAEEFDTRVSGIRSAQEAKSRALQQQAEAAQQAFFEIAFPILIEVLRGRGASILMDNRAVLLSADGIDITEEAIALINARIGEGGSVPLIDLDGTARPPAPAPDPSPEAAP
ncbi:OmpH family outer membrane protein [Roseicyclus mahoneyensis]|uniref:Periplasmic chaperone for outer membrane proteins Skp n=1 Tax=Roseicyclus mahoneyensis TaxID=164332 RepID=A0A316H533_9RHOB|nr:OmpH family outer membrane protein [Roseicyclus mahoneyensis]PWK62693.1 periplasmic chaperone for outer membrane proteins Skp [Roseicyclus mahoneyensis]